MLQGQNVAGMRCPFVCTAVQHVPATESTFQPITYHDQICSRSCIGKNQMTATDSGVRFDCDQMGNFIVELVVIERRVWCVHACFADKNEMSFKLFSRSWQLKFVALVEQIFPLVTWQETCMRKFIDPSESLSRVAFVKTNAKANGFNICFNIYSIV